MREYLSFDVETTGLKPWGTKAAIFAYSTCDEDGAVKVFRLDGKSGVDPVIALNALARLWMDRDYVLVFHNAKFDMSFIEKTLGARARWRADDPASFEDTLLLSHIVRNDIPQRGLKDMAHVYAGVPKDDEAEVRRYTSAGGTYADVPVDVMKRYQEADAERTMLLWLFFSAKLRSKAWAEAYLWEKRLIRPTIEMERRGVLIDIERTKAELARLQTDAESALTEAAALLGYRADIGKDTTVRRILFETLRLPILERTETGLPSVDKQSLAELARIKSHPLLTLILKYRSWKLGISRLSGYLDHVAEDGCIHPSIWTCQARTGRESCSEPNLQNVEKSGDLKNPFPIPARRCFRPRPGFVNLHIDYAGIELRLLVHYSQDAELVKCIRASGDPHYLAAQSFYPAWTPAEIREFGAGVNPIILPGIDGHEPKSEAWKTLRGSAKNCNFAVPYGANWKKAAAVLALPEEIGKRRFKAYRRRFPKLVGLSRTVGGQVRRKGGVETVFGRWLHVSRAEAYVGTNYLIQGTAAEILKRAQVRVYAILTRRTFGQAKMLLPIHDELIIEWPRNRLIQLQSVGREIVAAMTYFPQFSVPLSVEMEIATIDWARKTPFELEPKGDL